MSVLDLGLALTPAQGLLGPPNLMLGDFSNTGDATGGTQQISFDLDLGFMWMPLTIHINTDVVTAQEFSWIVNFLDKNQAAELGETITRPLNTTFEQNFSIMIPRIVFRAVQTTVSTPQILVRTANINGRVLHASVWALRWPSNAFPGSWLALFTAPP